MVSRFDEAFERHNDASGPVLCAAAHEQHVACLPSPRCCDRCTGARRHGRNARQRHGDRAHGRGFYKGGHDAQTANSFVCLERGRRCVLLLANDVRAEAGFGDLVRFVLGETGVPYDWEYAGQAGKS